MRRLLLLFGGILITFSTGCFHNPMTPACQQVRVTVHDHAKATPVADVIVTGKFPAEGGFTPFVHEQLEYGPRANVNTAHTDHDGLAVVPVMITGPGDGPGPDQITHGPIAFRVASERHVEFFHCPSAEVGACMRGTDFDLRIAAIGKPYARD